MNELDLLAEEFRNDMAEYKIKIDETAQFIQDFARIMDRRLEAVQKWKYWENQHKLVVMELSQVRDELVKVRAELDLLRGEQKAEK